MKSPELLRSLLVLLSSVGVFLACSKLVPAQDWTQWRGEAGQGYAEAHDLPVEFSAQQGLVWQTDLPGKGWSSPVANQETIWLTTAIEEAPTAEELEELSQRQNARQLQISGAVSLRAIGVSRQTGEITHEIELNVERRPQPIHNLNSYASPSPILDEDRLYCHFGAHGTYCIDINNGEVLWIYDEIAIDHENGPGSTPILWDGILIIHCDGTDEQYIVGLDAGSGELLWRTERSGTLNSNPQLKKAYGTPIILEVGGTDQVISPAADWLYAYDPKTGRELWKLPYGELGFSIVPKPVHRDGVIFFSTCFMRPKLLAVRLPDGERDAEIIWKQARQAPNMPSPLLVDELLFMVSDGGIASCLHCESGEIVWTARLGGNFSSSPMLADGKVYVGNRDGELFVFEPAEEYQPLAINKLDGAIMATPIAIEDTLYVRTEGKLYSFRESSQPE